MDQGCIAVSRSWSRCSPSRSSARPRSSCRSRARTSSSDSASTAHAERRVPYPRAVRRERCLPAQPEGGRARHSGADLHHEGQRAGRHRRRVVSAGARRGARVVRHFELPLRDLAARADHVAQRDRQDRSRSHVRGTLHDQFERRERARQSHRAVGREGAALRDQEHQSAARHHPGHGKADARRAGEARRDSRFRRRSRRQDQPGRRREAARDQGVRGQDASSRSTKRRVRPRRSSRSPRRRPKACGAWPSPSARRAAAKRCSCAWPRNTSDSSATSRAPRTRS